MLTNKTYLLEKFQGKGGWTYARIPEVKPDKHNHFGWVRVRGSIDGFEIKNYHLQPMGNGRLFLPVKAAIRKQIKKQAGDYVHIILFADDQPVEIPEELEWCLSDEPGTLEKFKTLTNGKKKQFIEWIYDAKTAETKTTRIVQLINDLVNNKC